MSPIPVEKMTPRRLASRAKSALRQLRLVTPYVNGTIDRLAKGSAQRKDLVNLTGSITDGVTALEKIVAGGEAAFSDLPAAEKKAKPASTKEAKPKTQAKS